MPELHFNITGDASPMMQQLKSIQGGIEATIRQGKSADEIREAFDNAFNSVNDKLSQVRKAVSSLEEEYARLGKEANNAFMSGDDSTMRRLKAEQNEIQKEIAEYKAVEREIESAGDALEAFQSIVEKDLPQDDRMESMRAKFMGLRNELINVTLQYRDMSAEERESAEGQALKSKMESLQKEAGKLKDAMADVNRTINSEAHDARGFRAATQAAQLAIGAWGGVTSALQAFGVKSEDVEQIQANLQAALAASNALTQAQLVLQKESELMNTVAIAQEGARAMAIRIRTAAEGKGVIATKAATIAQAAFNVVANANPYVLLATAVMTVVGGIWLLVKAFKGGTKAQKEDAEAAKQRKEAEAEANKQAATTAANAMTKYQDLRKEWKKLKTESEKNKFLKDNADAFKELGLAIDGVNGAEKFFNAQTASVAKAFELRARAAAISTLIQKEWEKYYEQVTSGVTYMKAKNLSAFSRDELKAIGVRQGAYGTYFDRETGKALTAEQKSQKTEEGNAIRRGKAWTERSEADEKLLAETQKTEQRLAKKQEELKEELAALQSEIGLSQYKPTATTSKRGGAKKDVAEREREAQQAEQVLRELQDSNAREREKEAREHADREAQARIDGMKEGLPKILEQMKLDHRKEQDELDDEYEDALRVEVERQKAEHEKAEALRKAQNEKYVPTAFVLDEAGLTAIDSQFVSRRNELRARQDRDSKKQLDEWRENATAVYMDVAKRRAEIEKKYAEAEQAFYDNDGKFTAGYSRSDIDALNKQRQDELAGVDEQIAQQDEHYKELVASLSQYTIEQITQLLEFAEGALADAQSSGSQSTQRQIAVLRATVVTLRKQKATLDKQDTSASRSAKRWNKAASAIGLCGDALQDLGKQIGGTVGDMVSAAGEISSTVANAIGGISRLVDNSANAMKATAEAGKESISSIEKASVILTVISAALQVAMKIASLFNNDARHQKKIEALQHQIDLLKEKYEELGKVASQSFSRTAVRTIEQQNELLEQQRKLVQQQLDEERAKKKTDKQAVYDYEKTLREIERQIDENREAAVDAIFGNDLQSAISDFADAYADAWGEGNSRAKAARDWVKHAIQNMVKELMKADIADKVEALRSQMMQFWSDNIITEAERRSLNIFANNIQREMDERYKWADDIFRSADESGDGMSGGFATMSQDSADELNGRFTSLQVTTQDIRAQLAAALSQMQEASILSSNSNTYLREIRDIQIINSNYLADIARDTRNLSPIRDDIARIAHNTDNL